MENKAHALVAGLFLLLLGAALAATLVWFRGDHESRTGYTVVARHAVSGLVVKAPVRLRGVDVGKVEDIGFDPADPRRILVHIAVDSSAPLTRGTYAQLSYQGVTGLSFVDLSDRGDDLRPLAALPESERQLELKPSLIDQLSLSGPALLTAFAATTERLNALLAPQNQQRVERLLDSGDRALERLSQRAEELRPAVAALAPAIRQFDAASRRADGALQRVDEAADEAAHLTAELRTRMAVLDRVGDAARRVETAARSFELGLVGTEPPPVPPLLTTLSGAAQAVDRATAQWAEQPQSLIFGRTPPRPGPGEPGFEAAQRNAP